MRHFRAFAVWLGVPLITFLLFSLPAGYLLLLYRGARDLFVFPYLQWWQLLYKYWGDTRLMVWAQIIIPALIGAMLSFIFLMIVLPRAGVSTQRLRTFRNSFWRPEMRRREWERPPEPPTIGVSSNHGTARFATEDEQYARFPPP